MTKFNFYRCVLKNEQTRLIGNDLNSRSCEETKTVNTPNDVKRICLVLRLDCFLARCQVFGMFNDSMELNIGV